MSAARRDGRARGILAVLSVLGAALACIPLFLTPPAYVDLSLRDKVFGTDLTGGRVVITNDLTGQRFATAVDKARGLFLARIGRIDSGQSTFSVLLDGYKRASVRIAAAPLQKLQAAVDLTPAFGRLEILPVDATQDGTAVPATVQQNGRVVARDTPRVITLTLPPGRHRFSASAPGYCNAEREFTVREGEVTREAFPLSPAVRNGELARFVLGWPNDPADLDSHFRRVGTAGRLNSEHLFYRRREAVTPSGVPLATLDVDRRIPRGFETVTVRDSAVGDFEYWVHLFAGQGTLGGSAATVTVYTRGCEMRTFHVPPDCAHTIWSVTTLRNDGSIHFTDQNRCEQGQALEFGGKAPVG
jgi:hypothetical protein